jgi:hypothetical protein
MPWAVPSLHLRDKNGWRSDHHRAWWRTLVSYCKSRPRTGRKNVYADGVVDGAMVKS